MESELTGQAVLVTGASGGIGEAISRLLAAEGASVAVHYFTNRPAAEEISSGLGPTSVAVGADLRDEGEVDAMFDQVLSTFGRLDHLVVNAGIWEERPAPLSEMTLAQWRNTLDADLTSAFLTCRAFLRHLADQPRQHASIVLVGSTAALFGEAEHGDYAAAKAGLVYGLTQTLKNEIVNLAPRGRVNCVCPGWTVTPMAAAQLEQPGVLEHATATMPLKKVARPEDIASVVTFLASERLAGHLTGTIIPVAGGMEGRLLEESASQ